MPFFFHGRSREDAVCARCAAPRARWDHPRRQNAPRRPAAMAGEAHPVPSRTRKLSPRAPIVLRVQPVGDQDAAGRLGAFSPQEGPRAERGALLFCAGVVTRHLSTGLLYDRNRHLAACLQVTVTICLPFILFVLYTWRSNDMFRSPLFLGGDLWCSSPALLPHERPGVEPCQSKYVVVLLNHYLLMTPALLLGDFLLGS